MREESEHVNWQLLHRFVAGECTPAEAEAVDRWIEANPSRRTLVESLRDLAARAQELPEPPVLWNAGVQWQRLEARLGTASGATVPAARPRGRMMSSPRSWIAARAAPLTAIAAALVLAVAGLGTWLVSRATGPAAVATAPASSRQYTTPNGQRAQLTLGDGSRVVLAPGSVLRVPADYGRPARELVLEGQAYFEVEHDEARPFRVRTALGVAEDLGTEFVVTAYPETEGMQVAVAAGVVALYAGRDSTIALERGDVGRIDVAGRATVARDVDVGPYLSWTTGRLAFDGMPLRDALAVLGRWYDLDFRLADRALADRRLVAAFGNEPVSEVLELLALTLDARYERQGRTVTLHAGRARTP